MKALRNNGKRRLGVPGRPAIILAPGESQPITDEQLKEIKRNRTVVRWLDRGVLQVLKAGDVVKTPPGVKKATPKPGRRRAVDRGKREKQVLPEGVTGDGVEIHSKGGGWYELWVHGFKVTDRSVRKDEVEAMVKDYE